ncbi:GH32 C-terminal domain-containing protein [Microlunatus ginsengisoli]|uniref:Levanase n=1 Tax=Microlunatus ginsengisoli TaxID=363863 RepID=A0ABP7AV13_9ACTN
MRVRRPMVAVLIGLIGLLGLGVVVGCTHRSTAVPPRPLEQYRPAYHFTPDKNWMNDPNGLVYYRGTYHLFFQHNPQGTTWGNMSWGHATSTDLVNWTEQPLAIPQTFDSEGNSIEDIFSGSVVVDVNNTSGFGTRTNPPMVAIYTSAYTAAHPEYAGLQAQSLAYSLDQGKTWRKYSGNPVLNRNSANFRDPKVCAYDGPAGKYWVMVAVEATEHRVLIYKSTDLKNWARLSDFGPANATAGVWECPDLFPIKVTGSGQTKWVMIVNLSPGSVAGGSGGQYFIGDFDGTRFTSDTTVTGDPLPPGQTLAGFDDGSYENWTVANEPGNAKNGPWGQAPATGTLPGQNSVGGYVGAGLVNGFNDGDWPLGTLQSPSFTIGKPYLNFLVGGGNHPHVDGSQLANDPPPGRLLFDGFEFPDGTDLTTAGWALTGDFTPDRNPSTAGGDNYIGRKRLNTFEGGPKGDDNVGTMTSPAFTLDQDYLSFLIGGGGRTDGTLQAELLIGDDVVRTATGKNDGVLNWQDWDVRDLRGRQARLRIVDQATGGWGHLTFDHPVLGAEPAKVHSLETSVNLVVDGTIVRTATGGNGETLDWTSWDVRDLVGKQATIKIIDNNRSGWGHVLADQFMTADAPAPPRIERFDWLDWGRDDYASVRFNDAPNGKIITLGWMNNWDYATEIPTSTWRSSMTLPRQLSLEQTSAGLRLVQTDVQEMANLRKKPALQLRRTTIADESLLPVRGDVVQIDATFKPGTADRLGLSVLGNGQQKTVIGYDARTSRLYVDRTGSGNVDFHPAFASIDDAPVVLADGRLKLRVYVDRASVEVFAQGGLRTITDQVFPPAGADRIGVWSSGGSATIESLTVTPLRPMSSRR